MVFEPEALPTLGGVGAVFVLLFVVGAGFTPGAAASSCRCNHGTLRVRPPELLQSRPLRALTRTAPAIVDVDRRAAATPNWSGPPPVMAAPSPAPGALPPGYRHPRSLSLGA